MAISLIQSIVNSTSLGITATIGTLSANVISGNTIIVLAARNNTAGSWSGFADSLGNSYNQIISQQIGAINFGMYYASNISGGSLIGTATNTGSTSNGRQLIIREYSGLANNSLDQLGIGTNTISSGSSISGTVTTTVGSELAILGVSIVDNNISISPSSPFIHGTLAGGGVLPNSAMADQILSSIGNYSGTFTHINEAGTRVCVIATFMAAGGAVASPTAGYRSLLGVGV